MEKANLDLFLPLDSVFLIEEIISLLKEPDILQKFVITLAIIVVGFVAKTIALYFLRLTKSKDHYRAYLTKEVRVKKVFNLTMIILFAIIWIGEVKAFSLSLAAISVAFVIATKDFWQCLLGGYFGAKQDSFRIGDIIEVKKIKGEVVDTNFFATTVLEIGPKDVWHHTGRIVKIPNSFFLRNAIYNNNISEHLIIHTFKVPMATKHDLKAVEETLFRIAQEETKELNQGFNVKSLHQEFLNKISGKDPTITVYNTTSTVTEFYVRVVIPLAKISEIEQRIIKRFHSTPVTPASDGE